jgi:hypothetical protein
VSPVDGHGRIAGVDDDPIGADDLAAAAAGLAEVLQGLRAAPDTTATPVQLAYLRGCADTLAMLAALTDGERPTLFNLGHPDRRSSGAAFPQDG